MLCVWTGCEFWWFASFNWKFSSWCLWIWLLAKCYFDVSLISDILVVFFILWLDMTLFKSSTHLNFIVVDLCHFLIHFVSGCTSTWSSLRALYYNLHRQFSLWSGLCYPTMILYCTIRERKLLIYTCKIKCKWSIHNLRNPFTSQQQSQENSVILMQLSNCIIV